MSYDIQHQDEFYSLIIDGGHIQMSNTPLATLKEHFIIQTDRHGGRINILEYGSGMSTVWFAKNFPNADIIAIEGDKNWLNKVSGWLEEARNKGVTADYELRFIEQTGNWRTMGEPVNPEYLNIPSGPFDLIINDGCVRELVADTLMLDMDKYLKPGGLYLRHDYEKMLSGDWVGIGLDGKYERKTYEQFCVDHPNYSVVTLNGNGTWGAIAEFGGLWRRP